MDCLSPLGKTSLVQVGIGNIHVVSVQNRSFIVDVNCAYVFMQWHGNVWNITQIVGKGLVVLR